MNTVNISGRLTKDTELRKTASGISVVSLNLACDRPHKKDTTDFIPVVLWSQAADYIHSYAKKGTYIEVTGWIETGSYESQGKTKYTWHVKGELVKITPQPKQRENVQQNQSESIQQNQNESVQQTLGGDVFPNRDRYGNIEEPTLDISADELPFY